ncbi:MAG: hypothetical protein RIQ53_4788 [Pseudomonadota bacterium]|jgi:rhodanese-related sulfurtransferase
MTDAHRLDAAAAARWLDDHPDALVLDARDARVHALGHIRGARGQVLRLDGRNHEHLLMREPRERPVLVYCYHGNASQTYAGMFRDFGFTQVRDLIGGFEHWAAAGLPVHVGVAAAPSPLPAPVPAPAGARVGAPVAALLRRPAPPPVEPQAPAAPQPVLPAALAAWLRLHGLSDAHAAGAHGNTPLMEAAWRGEVAMVAALLALGVARDAVNDDGNNALWLGCVSDKPALVRRLAQAGMPLDHANLTGATALMYAASSGKAAIVATLLDLGADWRIRTQDDWSALDMAATLDCLRLLRAASRAAA